MILNEQYTLANGVQIPKLGFGTWLIPDGEVAVLRTIKPDYGDDKNFPVFSDIE